MHDGNFGDNSYIHTQYLFLVCEFGLSISPVCIFTKTHYEIFCTFLLHSDFVTEARLQGWQKHRIIK